MKEAKKKKYKGANVFMIFPSHPSEIWNYAACLDGTSVYITTEAILPICIAALYFSLNDGAIFHSNTLQ